MKAKAPEKIYLQEPTKVRTEKKYDNDVEYVRKDAFIEKAAKFFIPYIQDNSGGYERAAVIEAFRNYMEGE